MLHGDARDVVFGGAKKWMYARVASARLRTYTDPQSFTPVLYLDTVVDPSSPEPENQADEQLERAQQRVGSLIGGKWRIERVLGVGGMASVYRAVHRHNQRKVAIKVLHDELSRMQDVRERFRLEGHAANRVGHPGAVPALDDGVLENGTPYLVLDFLEGQSLDRRWKKNNQALSVEEVFAVSEQLLDILEAAHRNGVLHRDIKPENVILTTAGEVKLLDFGISSVTGVDRTHKTELGATMGTPAFMSPEQARGRWLELDARADLFAVGATMYTLLSGEIIHQADTANELLLKLMTEPVSDVSQVAPHVPEFAAQVVRRALAFEKENRYQSAAEMKQAVHEVNAHFGRGMASLLSHDDVGPRSSTAQLSFSTHGSTHRPVMSSDVSQITASDFASAPKRWAPAVVAALMALTAVFSFLYFRTSATSEPTQFSPVTAQDRAQPKLPRAASSSATAPLAETSARPATANAEPPAIELNFDDLPEATGSADEAPSSAKVGKVSSASSANSKAAAPKPSSNKPAPATTHPSRETTPPGLPRDPSKPSVDPESEAEFDPLSRRR